MCYEIPRCRRNTKINTKWRALQIKKLRAKTANI